MKTLYSPAWQAVEGEGKGQKECGSIGGKEEGMACKDAIVFLVFFVHQMNVKILIGQIL